MLIAQLLVRTTQLHGAKVATICSGRIRTWNEVRRSVERIAANLQGMNIRAGDRVAILSLNSDLYVDLYFAIPWIGAVLVPMNTRWSAAELTDCVKDCQPAAVIFDEACGPMAREIASHRPHLAQAIDIESLVEDAGEACVEPLLRDGDAIAGIFYTGGTTGRSKGVVLTERNLVANAVATALEFGYGPKSIYLHSAPMFHLGDGASTYAVSMMGGVHAALPAFDARSFLAAVEGLAVSHAMLAPTMLRLILDHPDFRSANLRTLTTLIYGTSPMPEQLLRDALTVLPGVGFIQGYGMTELSPLAAVLTPDQHVPPAPAHRLRSAGQPTFGVTIKIVGRDESALPSGAVGEICVRGDNVMLGYWKRPDETAAALRDGWMHTGDCGYFDEDGFLYVVDRLKDMIISGGENVYSAEVENALCSHAAVAQCAVFGIPHATWGEAVHAVVVLKTGQTTDAHELIDHCRASIAGYKIPKSISFQRDALPTSAAGKVLKSELRTSIGKPTT